MRIGNKNGNIKAEKIPIATITHPRRKMPTPAKASVNKIAKQIRAINATAKPPAPSTPLSGLTISCPLTTIVVVELFSKKRPQTTNANNNAEKAMVKFFFIR